MHGCCATRGGCAKPTTCSRPVYASFTEGFATKDLKEARALLDELTDLLALPAGGGLAVAGAAGG